MKRVAIVGAAAVLAAAALTAPASARGPIRVTTSVSPDWIYFADQVTARVVVVVDRTAVDTSSVEIATAFGPWEQAANPRTTTSETADVLQRTTVYTLRCVDFGCVPKGTVVQRFYLPVVTVSAQTVDGASLVVKRPWPPVNEAGRFLPPESGAVRPALLLQIGAPAERFRVDPGTAALGFDLAAAIVGLAALALALVELRRYVERRRHPIDERPPLVRALSLVRQAQEREADDRRRAVALVARLLPQPAAERTTAAEIAWSRPDPSPDELGSLAETIETTITESK